MARQINKTYLVLVDTNPISDLPTAAYRGWKTACKNYEYYGFIPKIGRLYPHFYKTGVNRSLWIMGWYLFFSESCEGYKVITKFKRLEE